MSVGVNVEFSRAVKTLDRMIDVAAGKGRHLHPAFQAAGMALLSDTKRDFIAKARGGADAAGVAWEPVSNLTKLLRQRGQKITDMRQLRSDKVEIGRDTGRLSQSLDVGAPGNILNLDSLAVTVGTNVEYAPKFDRGGTNTFKFDSGKQERLKKNIHRGDRRGKRRYNRVVSRLQKMSGRRYEQPARPIFIPKSKIPRSRLANYRQTFQRTARRIMEQEING